MKKFLLMFAVGFPFFSNLAYGKAFICEVNTKAEGEVAKFYLKVQQGAKESIEIVKGEGVIVGCSYNKEKSTNQNIVLCDFHDTDGVIAQTKQTFGNGPFNLYLASRSPNADKVYGLYCRL